VPGAPRTEENARRLWLSRYLFRQAERGVMAGQFEEGVRTAEEAVAIAEGR